MINQQAYIILNFTDNIKSEISIIQTQVFREQIEQLKEKVSFFEQKMFVIN
jgi:predicted nucleic acid-binding protein